MNSLLITAVLAVAVIFSMLGLGGGALYVPILIQAGLPFHSAVATSLLIMLVMSLTATVVYHMNKLIDWKLLLILEPVSILGAVLGSYNSNLFPERVLYIIFAIAMLGSAFFTFIGTKQSIKTKLPDFPGIFRHTKKGEHYDINLWYGLPIAFAAGFISSIIGLGGGFAKVPLMTLGFGMPINSAAATSSAMIVITALAGFAGHSAIGHVDFRLAGILAGVVFIGALIGSRISVKADKKFLKLTFACIQLLIAAWMVYKAVQG